MITERTLRKWRREALITMKDLDTREALDGKIYELCERVLKMTTVLMDLHLVEGGVR